MKEEEKADEIHLVTKWAKKTDYKCYFYTFQIILYLLE